MKVIEDQAKSYGRAYDSFVTVLEEIFKFYRTNVSQLLGKTVKFTRVEKKVPKLDLKCPPFIFGPDKDPDYDGLASGGLGACVNKDLGKILVPADDSNVSAKTTATKPATKLT